MSFVESLDRKFYPGVRNHWDDRVFREFVLSRLDTSKAMLDLGAGAGILEDMNFKGRAGRICGLDPDQRVVENPNLDEGRVGYGEQIPWADETFDLVIADNVLEHLERPIDVFKEVRRVLKPGGSFLFKTPNRRHYVATLSRITPMAFHRYFNKLRGRDEADTFPTCYLVNTPQDVDRVARAAGLESVEYKLIESRPEYLRVTSLTYVPGIAYERLVNSTELLSRYRVLLMGEVRRPAGADAKDAVR